MSIAAFRKIRSVSGLVAVQVRGRARQLVVATMARVRVSGVSKLSIFVGGMTPLVRRVPKRGFHNRFAIEVAVVNVGQIDKAFDAGEEVTLESLAAKNLGEGSLRRT